MRASLRFALLPLSLLLALPAGAARPLDAPLPPGGHQWLGEGAPDAPLYMIVSLQRQMVHVYSGDRLIGRARVSTGTAAHATPLGDFSILQKRRWHRSNLYSNAPMPFMQRLTWDGIALHAGHNPGYPASHGCIRLPWSFAQRLFGLTAIGTSVEVTRARLRPALQVDPLLLVDRGAQMLTFTPGRTLRGPAPKLRIDPAIFPRR